MTIGIFNNANGDRITGHEYDSFPEANQAILDDPFLNPQMHSPDVLSEVTNDA